MVMPEDLSDKAEVEGDSEVENGKTLKFKVTPDEGYEVEVTANGNVLEGHKGMLGLADYYNYRVADVKEDLDIEINVTGEETEGGANVDAQTTNELKMRVISYYLQ